jgi:ABC-type multidrug transport system ATPase subunit
MNIITAQKLIKEYNGLRAVDGVDFAINEGECFGFLGPNGAGKTTVLRIISCFMPPTAGSISVSAWTLPAGP